MSLQSDAAKHHISRLLEATYGRVETHRPTKQKDLEGNLPQQSIQAFKEYRFDPGRKWRFDYAVPHLLCANQGVYIFSNTSYFPLSVIELDGGTFQGLRTGHSSGVGLRGWREKNNAAMSLGWKVWHYAPEEVIKAARKSITVDIGLPNQIMDNGCLAPLKKVSAFTT